MDATFLELETADDSAHMHIGALMIFDPLPDRGIPSVERVRAHLAERLDRLPRYRQRLSAPRTGGLAWPTWVPDERFDVRRHVRRAALPPPGGQAELHEWAADYWSHRLDRSRPLWDVVLLSGLAGGRWALATKTHHCMVDGVGSVDAAYLLLDTEPQPSRRAASRSRPPGEHRAPSHHGAHLPGWVHAPAHWTAQGARMGAGVMRHPGRVVEALERSRATLELLVRDELMAAPRTSLNQPMGGRRRYTTAALSLDQVKAIRRARGGTINDVVLSVTAAGLRQLLIGRGERLPATLRAMVPMNVRQVGEELALGNRISSLFVELPVEEPDEVRRHRRIVEQLSLLKHGGQAGASSTIIALAGLAPPVLHATLARALFATRLFNVTITNVPGPQQTLYAFGAPMREVHPLVPLAAEHSVGAAILSYDGMLYFGLIADHASVPDLDVMATGIENALTELSAPSDRPALRPALSHPVRAG